MRILANQDMLKFVTCVHTVSCTVSIEDPHDFRQWFKFTNNIFIFRALLKYSNRAVRYLNEIISIKGYG